MWCYILITRSFKNKWYGTPESLIAFSNLSITVTNTFEGLVDLHVFIIKHMFLLVGRLLQSDRTKALVKYLASSSFKYYSVQETRKLLTLFKAHFFIDHSLRIFNKVFAFVDCTRLVIKTPILSDKLRQRFLLTDQKLWLASHYETLVSRVLLSSLYKNFLFPNTCIVSLKF